MATRRHFRLADELKLLSTDSANGAGLIKRMFLCDGGSVSANV